MRILGAILTAVGALNLVGAVVALYRNGSLPGGAMPAVMTALAIVIGIGVLRRQIVAWLLGFVLLGAAAIDFAAEVISFAADRESKAYYWSPESWPPSLFTARS